MAGFGSPKSNNKKINGRPKILQANSDNLFETAIKLHLRGDLENAERLYRKAIKNDCDHQDVYMNLGVICKASGRAKEAVSLYKKAIQINPSNPNAYFNLGNLYSDLGNLDQALASTLKSLELNPDILMPTLIWAVPTRTGSLDQALAPPQITRPQS